MSSSPLDRFRQFDFKHGIIHSRDKILHLGPADLPWLHYLSGAVGPGGLVLWVDRNPSSEELPAQVKYLREDITICDPSTFREYAMLFDVITLDIGEFPDQNKNRVTFGAERIDATVIILGSFLKRGGNVVFRETEATRTYSERLESKFRKSVPELQVSGRDRYVTLLDYN